MHEEMFVVNGRRYIVASQDVNKAVRDLVRAAAEAVGSNMGSLFLLDQHRKVLKPAVIANLPEEYIKGCGEIPVGQQCCGRAVLHGLPWHVEDIWNSAFFPPEGREAAQRAGVRACFSIPVVDAKGKCLGSLAAHFSEPHTPSLYEIERHRMFAELIAFALSSEAEAVQSSVGGVQSAAS
jgi:GAF domain-containing protein